MSCHSHIHFLCHNSWSWCSIGIWFQGWKHTARHSETCTCFQRLEPSRRQLAKIISVEHGHVGLTVDPIILKVPFTMILKKKELEIFFKTVFFYPQILTPRPWTASVFLPIVLSSKWTGVYLKVYRQNWQERVPGEEKANQLFKTNCNKWQICNKWIT